MITKKIRRIIAIAMAMLSVITVYLTYTTSVKADNKVAVSGSQIETLTDFTDEYTSAFMVGDCFICTKADGTSTIIDSDGEEILSDTMNGNTDSRNICNVTEDYIVYLAKTGSRCVPKLYDRKNSKYIEIGFTSFFEDAGINGLQLKPDSSSGTCIYCFEDGNIYIELQYTKELSKNIIFANIKDTEISIENNNYFENTNSIIHNYKQTANGIQSMYIYSSSVFLYS